MAIVNGIRYQTGYTEAMFFPVAEVFWLQSRYLTLGHSDIEALSVDGLGTQRPLSTAQLRAHGLIDNSRRNIRQIERSHARIKHRQAKCPLFHTL